MKLFFKSSLFAEPSDERLALVYINPDLIFMTTEDQGSVVSANPGLMWNLISSPTALKENSF